MVLFRFVLNGKNLIDVPVKPIYALFVDEVCLSVCVCVCVCVCVWVGGWVWVGVVL